MKEIVIYQAKLIDKHKRDAGSKRIIHGVECSQRPDIIKIIRYDDDTEVYLIEFDSSGNEIIDTFHTTIEGAKRQADFDWGISESDWVLLNEEVN